MLQAMLRLGLDCSGPLNGFVVIDMTDKAPSLLHAPSSKLKKFKEQVKRRKAFSTSSSGSAINRSTQSSRKFKFISSDGFPTTAHDGECENARSLEILLDLDVTLQLYLPTVYQPSNLEIFDEVLVSQFVEFNTHPKAHMPDP